jgi:hypothetical protein
MNRYNSLFFLFFSFTSLSYYSYNDGMSMLTEEHNGADEVPSTEQAPPPAVEHYVSVVMLITSLQLHMH